MKKRKEYDDDDGRTIANMNIDGMPWYDRRTEALKDENGGELPELTRKEKFGFYAGVLKAAMLVVLAFAGVYFLLIFILTKLWT